ncbi:hypothetical protein [Mesorhizobium sp. M4B.F.Ca.ET.058.02.1.1]|uniref:hypothetical protein n=1 Tax=Mesorhizobium sp. M4B.F.Ca.ET.058.02.1.1 TaxID=2493675 RepID=UPI000F755729|nr:hypothetical protein [Mesorhizobium sp. M4B.F.Ca.ET.058.02.1.1]AZO48040.1 hypothetical protein EJ073_09570 [Mesorhizobium sp. M4B.F.Ca.ET.058.02.1.1]
MSGNSCRLGAMKDAKIGVAAICQEKAYVVFNNGVQLPITRWLNADKQTCHIGEEPRHYEFGDEEHGYGTGSYDAYDMPSWEHH